MNLACLVDTVYFETRRLGSRPRKRLGSCWCRGDGTRRGIQLGGTGDNTRWFLQIRCTGNDTGPGTRDGTAHGTAAAAAGDRGGVVGVSMTTRTSLGAIGRALALSRQARR